jgi:hypothetical protein
MISLLFRVNKFAALLDELEQLLKSIAMMKELTLRSTDYLLSFGERMSTRIFAAYLNKCGVKARQVLLDVFLVSTCCVLYFEGCTDSSPEADAGGDGRAPWPALVGSRDWGIRELD